VHNSAFEQGYARLYAWFLRGGPIRPVLLMTVTATLTSSALTAALMWLVPGPVDFFWYGMFVAVASPLLSAPFLSVMAVRMVYQLKGAQAALARAAETDALTGVANRRSFIAQAEATHADCQVNGGSFAVVMIDIDHFKSVNDRHGHAAGDAVLHTVAQACKEALRANDRFARYGGEEFVALLRGTDQAGAIVTAEKLRDTIAALRFELRTPVRVTASLGVAVYGVGKSLNETLNEADRQLYAAKAAGRNRTMALFAEHRLAS
jgi:diguanylate cyclase (GGDEF)-like protein